MLRGPSQIKTKTHLLSGSSDSFNSSVFFLALCSQEKDISTHFMTSINVYCLYLFILLKYWYFLKPAQQTDQVISCNSTEILADLGVPRGGDSRSARDPSDCLVLHPPTLPSSSLLKTVSLKASSTSTCWLEK